jgi:DNA-binding transcriptional LysR family regulator
MFALTTVPRLIEQLRREAPNLMLQSRNLLDQHTELLASGALDFAINLDHPYTKEFHAYRIGSGRPGVWLRRDHPLAEKPALDAKDLAELPAVRVYLPDMLESAREQAASELAASGIDNTPILETTQLLVGLEVLYRENAYMLGPNNLGDSSLANQLFTVRPLANEEDLENAGVELYLVQHQRTLNSPLHSWVREKILALTKMAPFG